MPSAPECDLHPWFRDPAKARAILDACIADNVKRGQSTIRVVHGRGSGSFRNLVHGHLEKHPDVEGFVLCDPMHGGEGATWVHLRVEPKPVKAEESLTWAQLIAATKWRWIVYGLVFLLLYIYSDWRGIVGAIVLIGLLEFLLWEDTRNP